MRSNYSALGFALVFLLAALAAWFILDEWFSPTANSGPTPQQVPPGTTPRQPEASPSNP